MTDETEKDRLERYRVEGAAHFIDGIIQGARDKGDAGMLLCAENAEKALRCLRVDKATLRAELAARDQRIAALAGVLRELADEADRAIGNSKSRWLIDMLERSRALLADVEAAAGVDAKAELDE